MTNTTQLSTAQKTALDFIASGLTWEAFALATFGSDRPAPRFATYQSLRNKNLIVVGPAGSYVVA